MSDDYIIVGGELRHYGVKGMKWGVRRRLKKDAQFRKRNSKLADKLEEDRADAIKIAQKSIAESQRNLKRYQNIDSHDYLKDAQKEIRFNKSYLKESHMMGDGGIKKPTDQDAIDFHFGYTKRGATLKDVAADIKRAEKSSVKQLIDYDTKNISEGRKYIETLSNMSLKDLYKNSNNLYRRDKIVK